MWVQRINRIIKGRMKIGVVTGQREIGVRCRIRIIVYLSTSRSFGPLVEIND